MAAIFNDVVIAYNGEKHTIKPTFALINKIEQPVLSGGLGISLAGLSAKASRGDVPISEVARVLGFLLRESGVDVADEDMYAEILAVDNEPVIADYVTVITTAFFPVSETAQKMSDDAKKK